MTIVRQTARYEIVAGSATAEATSVRGAKLAARTLIAENDVGEAYVFVNDEEYPAIHARVSAVTDGVEFTANQGRDFV